MRYLIMTAGLAACAGGADGEESGTTTPTGASACDPGPGATLTVGTGEAGYEAITDHVELVHGPQGGYHVLVAFEATHLDTSAFAIGYVEGTIGGEVVAVTQPYLDFRCNPDTDTQQTWGSLLIYPLLPEELDGQETVITATVTDAAGAEVSTSLTTTIVDPLL